MKGTVKFRNCQVNMDGWYCETVFPDGIKCTGTTALDRPDQVQSAKNMGYPLTEGGLAEMLCEHELAHNFVAEYMGDDYSIVHRLIAEKGVENLTKDDLLRCKREEDITGAFQTYVNSGEVTSSLHELDMSPTNLRNLKDEFIELISPFKNKFGS